jgi:hypothetical protein
MRGFGMHDARGHDARARGSGGRAGRTLAAAAFAAVTLAVAACDAGPVLDTRTFQVQYLPSYQVERLIAPYVFTDRPDNPGMMSVSEGAVTVRETADNLDKIARVLAEYDRVKPTVVLHFQIIEADGAGDADPAIAEVERELRRVLRFDGYRLRAETRITAIQGTRVRQVVGTPQRRDEFLIEGGVGEVRRGEEETTITLDVRLHAGEIGSVLETSVTIPAGHSVVLGTANTPAFEGALILAVRAEIVEAGEATP